MSSPESSVSHFLYAHYKEEFQALSRITGYATEILDEPGLADGASEAAREADLQNQVAIAERFFRGNLGPYALSESVEYTDYKDVGPVSAIINASLIDMKAQQVYQPPLEGEPTNAELMNRAIIFGLSDSATSLIDYKKEAYAPFREIASGRYSHYYHAYARTQKQLGGREPEFEIRVPIGEYGAEPSLRLLQSVYHTMGNPTDEQRIKIDSYAQSHADMLGRHVTWVRNVKNYPHTPQPLGFALSKSVYEGDLSIQQGISMLTAERVEGFDSAFDLWKAIRKAKLLDQFTRLLPFGNLAPATLMNSYIPGLVVPDQERGVALNPEVVSKLKDYKKTVITALAEDMKTGKQVSRNEMGIFCPAAVRDGGLEKRHDILFRRYIQLTNQVERKTTRVGWLQKLRQRLQ